MTRAQLTYLVKKSIRSIDPDARVILFGSRARGDDYPSSDWDFLILTSSEPSEETKKKLRASLIDAELESGEVISTIIHSKTSWINYENTFFFQNIRKDGIEL